MTDEIEKAARECREEIFKMNPNGFTVAPYVNGDLIEDIFERGAAWALKSERVTALVEAASDAQCECSISERNSGHRTECWMPALLEALNKFEAEGK